MYIWSISLESQLQTAKMAMLLKGNKNNVTQNEVPRQNPKQIFDECKYTSSATGSDIEITKNACTFNLW
jgi:hypothetical protein